MATSNTIPVVIPQPIAAQATSENINVIPNGATGTNGASFQEGFPAITRMPVIENPLPTQVSGLPPKQQDFNGLFNVVSQHNFFSQNGGTYSFNQAVSDAIGGYPKNSVLWYFPENGTPYLVYSLINNNTNNFVEDPTLIDDEHWKKLSFGGGGEIGDVMFVPLGIDESRNYRRYLNGQVLIQEQFVAFTNKVKSAIALFPNLATTEENWQAEKTNSKLGQCGKFVVDDTAGTIRLPCVVNAQGLVDLALIGGIKSESLPNITGNVVGGGVGGAASSYDTGAFVYSGTSVNSKTYDASVGESFSEVASFDASRSSSTYQDNAPVQQEAVQYPYCIVVNVGTEEADRPINNYQVNNVYSYGMSQYYKGTMNNNSWLKSAGQWNDGTVYTGMYNWLLEQMNAGVSGFVASTSAYTDYDFVINTIDQTFRLPLIAERVLVAKKEPTEDSTWFNWYSDGWLEQGGAITASYTGQTITLNMLKSFSNTNWTIVTTVSSDVMPPCLEVVVGQGKTNNSIGVIIAAFDINNKTNGFYWKACGYAEVPAQSDYTEVSGLYYYIGDTLQNAQLVNVARIEETLVDKADTDLSNCTKPYVTETYRSGTSWYRIWSDGWCEQGGLNARGVITLLKAYANTDYTVNATSTNNTGETGQNSDSGIVINDKTVSNFNAKIGYQFNGNSFVAWEAKGYIR